MPTTSAAAMPMLMEHAENNLAVPPLVDPLVLLRFCQAVQAWGQEEGAHDEVAVKIRALRAALASLQGLAMLCRFAVLGHPHSFARVVDELECLAVDFPTDPLPEAEGGEYCEDEPDDRSNLTAALDLFAGAAFVSKDDPVRRDRFVVALVRAVEAAIAFPVTFSAEAARYVGQGAGEIAPLHASIVIASAARRLLQGDAACVPAAPRDTRRRLEDLARRWMRANPVSAFFEAVSGPRVARIVHWEDPARTRPDDARGGDPVTILLRPADAREEAAGPAAARPSGAMAMSGGAVGSAGATSGPGCGDELTGLAVMFCPHQLAPVVRVVEDGLQVEVPEGAVTGPIAVVRRSADFTPVGKLIDEYWARYPKEMTGSVFGSIRMDQWAYPFAFAPPVLEVMKPNAKAGSAPAKPAGPQRPPPDRPPPPTPPRRPPTAVDPATRSAGIPAATRGGGR